MLLAHTVAYCAPWVLSAARIDTVQGWSGPPLLFFLLSSPPSVARSMTLFSCCYLVLSTFTLSLGMALCWYIYCHSATRQHVFSIRLVLFMTDHILDF